MKILCKTNFMMNASQQVNRIGKYLSKHMNGTIKSKQSPNTYDLYVTLLYSLKPEYGGDSTVVDEMTINISITTYQNKIRINTIEVTPDERTLGFDTINLEDISDLPTAQKIVEWKVGKRLRKAYENYVILF